MTRKQITLRLDVARAGRLEQLAQDAEISINQAVAALIERALAEGWTITRGRAVAVDASPGPSPLDSRAGRG